MAVVRRALKLFKITNSTSLNRSFSSTVQKRNGLYFIKLACGCAVGAGVLFYVSSKFNSSTVYAFKTKKKEDDQVLTTLPTNSVSSKGMIKLSNREQRFIQFASVVYHGQIYMTPQDFLESFIDQEPRPRLKRRKLNDADIEAIKSSTPSLSHGSTVMFRGLRDKGIISYTEYLFLLSILTKPQTGFRIAFNMYDTDGNERVDKNEFLVLQSLFAQQLEKQKDLKARSEEKHALRRKETNNVAEKASSDSVAVSCDDYVIALD